MKFISTANDFKSTIHRRVLWLQYLTMLIQEVECRIWRQIMLRRDNKPENLTIR